MTWGFNLNFRFKKNKLAQLYYENKGTEKYGESVVNAFFETVTIINAAKDKRDMRKVKSLHYEKLKGNRKHQHSVRLTDQWRLIFEIQKVENKYILIIDIEDYHH